MINIPTEQDYEDVPPLKCLFYAEFDSRAGPKIVYQYPDDNLDHMISKETFDSLSGFFITKPELLDKFIKVNTPKLKIMGHPVVIENKKYQRNAFIFNWCFVVDNVSHVDCLYEPLVRKMAHYLINLEVEGEYLSGDPNKTELKLLMRKVYEDLNEHKECSTPVNEKTRVHLKIMPKVYPPPKKNVSPHDAPVLRRPCSDKDCARLDVVSQKCLPHLSGFAPISQISDLVQMDKAVVGRCVENLCYHGMVSVLPVFRYSNSYAATFKLRQLYTSDDEAKNSFASSVALQPTNPPKFVDVFRLLCRIQPSLSIKDWCLRNNPRGYGVDERKLIQLSIYNGYLRKLTMYPASISKRTVEKIVEDDLNPLEANAGVNPKALDGSKTVDDLANFWCQRPSDTVQRLENRADIVLLIK